MDNNLILNGIYIGISCLFPFGPITLKVYNQIFKMLEGKLSSTEFNLWILSIVGLEITLVYCAIIVSEIIAFIPYPYYYYILLIIKLFVISRKLYISYIYFENHTYSIIANTYPSAKFSSFFTFSFRNLFNIVCTFEFLIIPNFYIDTCKTYIEINAKNDMYSFLTSLIYKDMNLLLGFIIASMFYKYIMIVVVRSIYTISRLKGTGNNRELKCFKRKAGHIQIFIIISSLLIFYAVFYYDLTSIINLLKRIF